jgi:hypothetical protein
LTGPDPKKTAIIEMSKGWFLNQAQAGNLHSLRAIYTKHQNSVGRQKLKLFNFFSLTQNLLSHRIFVFSVNTP